MKKIASAALCCMILASCTTMRVATNVLKQYPVTAATEEVIVYENGAAAPAEAEVLGEVTVYDDRMAKTEPWDTTLFRAKEAVSEVGGNALYIMEHIYPSFNGSSNHQLYGKMLFAPAGSVAVTDNPFTETYNQYVAQKEAAEQMRLHGSSIYATVGYGRLLSAYEFGDVQVVGGDIKNGIEAEAGYEYIFKSGLGLGVMGSMFMSGADVRPDPFYYGHMSLNIKSIMGTVSYLLSSDKWTMGTYFGFGYMVATNKYTSLETSGPSVSEDDKGPGYNLALDFSYRFSPKTSLGAKIGTKKFTFRVPGDENLYGYNTLNLGLIFRVSF